MYVFLSRISQNWYQGPKKSWMHHLWSGMSIQNEYFFSWTMGLNWSTLCSCSSVGGQMNWCSQYIYLLLLFLLTARLLLMLVMEISTRLFCLTLILKNTGGKQRDLTNLWSILHCQWKVCTLIFNELTISFFHLDDECSWLPVIWILLCRLCAFGFIYLFLFFAKFSVPLVVHNNSAYLFIC